MAGVYGEIDSRDDFHRVLKEARDATRRLLQARPDNDTIEVIDTQLDAMDRWTANGRVPREDERGTISIGLLAARELENTGDPQIDELVEQLESLHNYFEDWPSDADAAAATDDDFFDA